MKPINLTECLLLKIKNASAFNTTFWQLYISNRADITYLSIFIYFLRETIIRPTKTHTKLHSLSPFFPAYLFLLASNWKLFLLYSNGTYSIADVLMDKWQNSHDKTFIHCPMHVESRLYGWFWKYLVLRALLHIQMKGKYCGPILWDSKMVPKYHYFNHHVIFSVA